MNLLQRAILSRRVGRLVLEQLEGIPLVVLPDVFNPAVFRTSPVLIDAIGAHIRAGMRVLDLGTGTGVAAIAAATAGAHVTAVDINPEAARCARINVLLNRVDTQVDVHDGDLFAPVGGIRFDAVVCNPPFFSGRPNSARDAAWRSEDFIERFCAGLDDALDGSGFALVVFSNHADERRLLGALDAAGWRAVIDRTRALRGEVVSVYRVERGPRV
jgi:methylase of polypeptide subunit release factors